MDKNPTTEGATAMNNSAPALSRNVHVGISATVHLTIQPFKGWQPTVLCGADRLQGNLVPVNPTDDQANCRKCIAVRKTTETTNTK